MGSIGLRVRYKSLGTVVKGGNTKGSALVHTVLKSVPRAKSVRFQSAGSKQVRGLGVKCIPRSVGVRGGAPIDICSLLTDCRSECPIFLPGGQGLCRGVGRRLHVFRTRRLVSGRIYGLSKKRLREILLTLTIVSRPGLLLLSRPMSKVSRGNVRLFFGAVSCLGGRCSLTVVLVSRSLSCITECTSRMILLSGAILERKAMGRMCRDSRFRQVFSTKGRRA